MSVTRGINRFYPENKVWVALKFTAEVRQSWWNVTAVANQCLCVPRTLSPSTLSSFQLNNIGWVITVIYTLVLALSLNQIEGGLMTQIFRVTLPTVAEHKLRGGVVLFVLTAQLASDSFSEMNLCRSGPPHAEWFQNPSDWCPWCGHSSQWS